MQITVNLWAVLVAAIVHMAVGFFWYGPLFGKTWKHLMGFTNESMKHMKLTPHQSIAMGFVTAFIMAYVLGYLGLLLGVFGVAGAWKLAFWMWLGFLVTNTASSYIWEGKPFKLFLLNASAQLVSLFLMALVLVTW
ncbi:DUF1761 domain-containing protein [Candidatus Nomurabacteria bacterium]|nr:DUF1761 domain-containing protein [Candidatus Nomurabacteria bacterium]